MNKGDLSMTRRTSPLTLPLQPDQTGIRGGYEIALTYLGERGSGYPFVADLSHVAKWILQGRHLEALAPAGIDVPANPRGATLRDGILTGRLTPHECWVMVFGEEIPSFKEPFFTRVTDGYAAMAIVGAQARDVWYKLSPVDLWAPAGGPLCITQAPVEDVPCLIFRTMGAGAVPGLILCLERGYGSFILEAFLDAGKEFEIGAAGWDRFTNWWSDHPPT